jgi:hypothetical protein
MGCEQHRLTRVCRAGDSSGTMSHAGAANSGQWDDVAGARGDEVESSGRVITKG